MQASCKHPAGKCCAVLPCAALCSPVLPCAALCCAVLCCAVLCCAVLCCAVLCCAVLCCAVLRCAALRCAALLNMIGTSRTVQHARCIIDSTQVCRQLSSLFRYIRQRVPGLPPSITPGLNPHPRRDLGHFWAQMCPPQMASA